MDAIPPEHMIVLSPEAFDAFVAELDAPPRDIHGLRELLSTATILDHVDD